MINLALIGHGYWGSVLKRYIEENHSFKLIHVCDSKTDLTEVFADSALEAVVVAWPIESHYEIVRMALRAGKHVLSEKPLALKSSECVELKRLAEENGLVLQTEYVFLFKSGVEDG